MRLLLALGLGFSLGCAGLLDKGGDDDEEDEDDRAQDDDRDGYLSSIDCDDDDPAVNPGAAEVCDEADIDEDCSGAADDEDSGVTGASTFYADGDGDGLGDPATAVSACDPGEGVVTDATDCDDTDAAVGAEQTWYPDADGDGYGDADGATAACEALADHVAADGDCDDTDADVNPDAAEVCNGRDDDCDGDEDDADADVVQSSRTTWYADTDGDGYGDSGSSTVACDEPPDHVTDATDCDDGEASANPGESEVCRDGVDNDCDGGANGCGLSDTALSASTAHLFAYGEDADDQAGASVDLVGDVDGDGLDDAVIGAIGDDAGGTNAGAVYLVTGGTSGSLDLARADAKLTGDDANGVLGYGISDAGDVDGDGYGDFVAGAYLYGAETGAVYLVYGPVSGTRAIADAPGAVMIEGAEDGDQCGLRTSGGRDVSGDGRDDFIFGCPKEDGAGTDSGAAYLVTDAPSGSFTTDTSAWHRISGAAAGDGAGYTSALVLDVDGDGDDDVMVGGPADNHAWVLHGPISADVSLASADTTLSKSSGEYGFAVASAGDMDADGYGDVAVTRTHVTSGSTHTSYVYLYSGSPSGVSAASEIELTGGSGSEEDGEGRALDPLGDIDGDGFDDLLLSGPRIDVSVRDEGAAYLVLGPVTADADIADFTRFSGRNADDYTGTWSGGGKDFDGDGWPDLIVGSGGDDTGGSAAGGAFVLLGGGI